MQDRIPRPVSQRRIHRVGIRQIRYDQPRSGGNGCAVALLQIVEHHDLIAAFHQRQHDMAADKAGSAGDQETPTHKSRILRRQHSLQEQGGKAKRFSPSRVAECAYAFPPCVPLSDVVGAEPSLWLVCASRMAIVIMPSMTSAAAACTVE